MTFYDCFFGIGGARIGFERAGHKCVGGCEKGKWQRIIYERHFGEEKTQGDITKVEGNELPDFDFLTAGLPCQPFSTANTTGERGFIREDAKLLFDVLRLVEYKRPAFFVFENVSGLLSDSEGRSFATWLVQISKMGYDAEWAYLYGASFGLKCGHEHIFLIGWDNKRISPEKILPEWDTTPVYSFAVQKAAWQTIPRITSKTSRLGFDNNAIVLDRRGFRQLTPGEIEQIVGLPKGWTSGIPETARLKSLGNLWPPVMAEFIGNYCLPKGGVDGDSKRG
uniref:Putative methyltransferase n=1 Tax=viral metagenome TaxID=1070528 RepID=A0A6M3KJZ0_9ZZZZ